MLTIELTYTSVPLWLQAGAFFDSLSADDDSPIFVPEDCLSENVDQLNSVEELERNLSTIAFWGLFEPNWNPLIEFMILKNKEDDCTAVLSRFPELNKQFVTKADKVIKSYKKDKVTSALRESMVHAAQVLFDAKYPVDAETCVEAAKKGEFAFLQQIVEVVVKKLQRTETCVFEEQRINEDDDLVLFCTGKTLKSLKSLKNPSKTIKYTKDCACSLCKLFHTIADTAGKNGDLQMLQYATQNHGLVSREALEEIVIRGHASCLALALQFKLPLARPPYYNMRHDDSSQLITLAAAHGRLDCLTLLYKTAGMAPTALAIESAARHGHMEVVDYLLLAACPLKADRLLGAAARGGHLEILKRLRRQHIPWSSEACLAVFGDLNSIWELHEGAWTDNEGDKDNAELATNRLACLRYMRREGCDMDEPEMVSNAARNGQLTLLQYLLEEEHCTMDATTCAQVVSTAHSLPCLQYLRSKGVAWDARVCKAASEIGSLEILQWAHEQGCPWFEEVFQSLESVDCFQYALHHGCPRGATAEDEAKMWNWAACCGKKEFVALAVTEGGVVPHVSMCSGAAWKGDVDCLRYLHEELHCPWNEMTCAVAYKDNSLPCLKYAIEHGCPHDVFALQNGLNLADALHSLILPPHQTEIAFEYGGGWDDYDYDFGYSSNFSREFHDYVYTLKAKPRNYKQEKKKVQEKNATTKSFKTATMPSIASAASKPPQVPAAARVVSSQKVQAGMSFAAMCKKN